MNIIKDLTDLGLEVRMEGTPEVWIRCTFTLDGKNDDVVVRLEQLSTYALTLAKAYEEIRSQISSREWTALGQSQTNDHFKYKMIKLFEITKEDL